MDLKNKTALVTGSEGAIGSELVNKLTQNGVYCIKVDKNIPAGVDFANLEAVAKFADNLASKPFKLDFLFNVAGIGIYQNIQDLTIKEWSDSFSINVGSVFVLSKALLSSLVKSKNSAIFNIGSGMGVFPTEGRIAYCASKFALRGLSLSLAKELKSQGVDVCHLTLGSVMTPFGTGGIGKREALERSGKKYLTVDKVTDKIIEIAKSETREVEYVMYPEGYV